MTTELLRLRDRRGGHRLIVKDAAQDGIVRLSVAAGDTVSMGATLNMADLECLIAELTKVADRRRRELCVLCDSLGLVDGPDGLELCEHRMADVARACTSCPGTVCE
jgi:hypothetical protein